MTRSPLKLKCNIKLKFVFSSDQWVTVVRCLYFKLKLKSLRQSEVAYTTLQLCADCMHLNFTSKTSTSW